MVHPADQHHHKEEDASTLGFSRLASIRQLSARQRSCPRGQVLFEQIDSDEEEDDESQDYNGEDVPPQTIVWRRLPSQSRDIEDQKGWGSVSSSLDGETKGGADERRDANQVVKDAAPAQSKWCNVKSPFFYTRLRLGAAALLTLLAVAITSLIIAGGTRQVLIHSVNKSLGQMVRIDASLLEEHLGLTAITSSWLCDGYSAVPGLAHPLDGSVESLEYLFGVLAQPMTAQGALITHGNTAALAAYMHPGSTTALVGMLNVDTNMCWETYEVDLNALVPLPGVQTPVSTDCEFISSGRFEEMVGLSAKRVMIHDPFQLGPLRAAARMECANAVVTAYSDLHEEAKYLSVSTERMFKGFWPDLGVRSSTRVQDTHEMLLVNATMQNAFVVAADSHPDLQARFLGQKDRGVHLDKTTNSISFVGPFLYGLIGSQVGTYANNHFMAAAVVRTDQVTKAKFAEPMVVVVVVPSSQFLGFMPNLIVLNFIICLALVGLYVALLWAGLPDAPKKGDSIVRRFRCLIGGIATWDARQQYLPVVVLLVMLLITTGLWRSALDRNVSAGRKAGISHHTAAIGEYVDLFTGSSVMTFRYAKQLYAGGRMPLPPTPATIPALDTAFGSLYRPVFPFAGIVAVYIGMDTDEMAGAGWINDTYAIRAKDPTTPNGYFTWFKMDDKFQRGAVLSTTPDYVILKRDWFTNVDPSGAMRYLPPYHFHSFVGYGIAWNCQINVTWNGVVHKTVLAVETLVIQISNKLALFRRSVEPGQNGDAIFLIDRQGLLIGSADKVVTKGKPGTGKDARDERISPADSPNAAVRATYAGLTRWLGQPVDWKPPTSLVVNQDGDLGPYVVSVTSLKSKEDSRDWLLVLAYPDTETRKLEPILIMTLILSLATGLLILYATTAILDSFGGGAEEDDTTLPPSSLCSSARSTSDGMTSSALALKDYLLPRILNKGYTALTFITMSWSSLDALELLRVDSKTHKLKSWMYRLFHSRPYTFLITVTVLGYLFLSFYEAPVDMRRTAFDGSFVLAIVITASFILTVLAVDAVVWLVGVGLKVPVYEPNQVQRGGDVVVSKRDLFPVLYALLLIAFIVELILLSEGWYNKTLVESDDQGQVVVLLLPSTAFLRPLLLMFRFREARQIARRFLATIFKALPVLALFLLIILLTSAMSNLLFAGRIKTSQQGQGFGTLLSSFVQSFVMSTCGDNFGEVVNSLQSCARTACSTPTWVYMYFIGVTLVGTVLTVSLLIQAFQEHYVAVYQEHLDKTELDRDVNMVAAYCVLDSDDNGMLDTQELAVLLKDMASASGIGIKVKLERPPDETFLTLPVFLRLARKLEPLGWFRPYVHKQIFTTTDSTAGTLMSPAAEVGEPKDDCFDRTAAKAWGSHIVHVVLILNFTSVALYGYVTSPHMLTTLDVANLGMLCYWAAEPLYPCIRYGFRTYWHLDDDFYLQTTRRFVFVITVVPLVVFIISRIATQRMLWSPWVEDGANDPTRVVLTLPLIRVLVLLPGLRRMCLGLMVVLYNLGEQLAGCALMLYCFAAIGCRLFAGKLSLLETYPYETLNFDSMRSSLMVLYNLFISGNVTEVLDGIMDTGSLLIALLYFLLFLFLIEVIYLSLVTSVVCQLYEATQRVNQAAEAAKRPFTSLDFWVMFSEHMRNAFTEVPSSVEDSEFFKVKFPEAEPGGAPVDWTLEITLK